MNPIDQQIKKIQSRSSIGLMTHLVIGYPSLAATEAIAMTMAQAGADFIELQMPFSDPIADGPAIMAANTHALSTPQVTMQDNLAVMAKLASTLSIPLLFMGYFNSIYRYGTAKFCRDAHAAGASGVIIPDMPIDEEPYEHYFSSCQNTGLYPIQIVSPITPRSRLHRLAHHGKGFVYCVSRFGTTGDGETIVKITPYLARVRKAISLPIAVGFGISTPDQIQKIAPIADIAVVGSAILKRIPHDTPDGYLDNIYKFIQSLTQK